MDFLRDTRVWWAVAIIILLILLAWVFGLFGVEEPVPTAPEATAPGTAQ